MAQKRVPWIVGKKMAPVGVSPAIVLIEPKYARNVGGVVRAASCFGIRQVWFTGDRISIDTGKRLPREERMRGYKDVALIQFDYPLDQFEGAIPVAVEILPSSEDLRAFAHPPNAVYMFGPEDGEIPQVIRRLCHRFVTIPSNHCLNLAAAVNVVLYDRDLKSWQRRKQRKFWEGRGVPFYDQKLKVLTFP